MKNLPYISHWHTGVTVPGFGPKFQLGIMEKYPIIPWYIMPIPGNAHDINYYKESILEASRLHLPITFVSTQFEILFSKKEYTDLPMGINPNIKNNNGVFENVASPFGSTKLWRELGYKWSSQEILKQLQKWYRDPPFVLFVSNNEHPKLRWNKWDAYQDPLAKFGVVSDDDSKRKYIGEGYTELYNSLFAGIKQGLINENWQSTAKLIGYNAFVPSFVGRWHKWPEYSLHTKDCVSPWINCWDGASLPYYTNPWDGSTDCNVWSVQTEAMNWAASLELIKKDFWVELSIWDGSAPGKSNDKRLQYEKAGQVYSPERYKGSAQFGIWLLRPNSVREFRSHNEDIQNYESYFLALCECIKSIHSNSILKDFWQNATILKSDWGHPYQTDLPPFLKDVNRSYLLWNNLLPVTKKLHDLIPVFSIGFIRGNEYLIYAHAPLGEKKDVTIVFNNKSIKVDVPVEGSFWFVDVENNVKKI